MISRFGFVAAMAVLLVGCGGKTYEQQIDELPIASAQAEIDKQCGQMRSEIARQKSIFALNPSPIVAVIASKNIATLENRAALLKCGAAFSSFQAVPNNPIEQCIAACKANTAKNAEECFTACNH